MRLHQLPTVACILAASLLVGAGGTDEEVDDPEISQFVRDSANYVDQLKVQLVDNETPVERVKKPVLVYRSPAPDAAIGSLWIWGKPGRPKSFAEVIQFNGPNGFRVVALSHSASDLLSLTTPDNLTWKPRKPQIEPQIIADSPAPSENEDERKGQMAELAMRLKSFELWEPNNTRYELTMLERPVLRYREESVQVQDGSAFVIANDRNPEIIVLIEAIGESIQASRWHMSFARMGSAELHVELDGREIWQVDRAKNSRGEQSDFYWLYATKR